MFCRSVGFSKEDSILNNENSFEKLKNVLKMKQTYLLLPLQVYLGLQIAFNYGYI